jgi:hypothetical protein
MVVHRLLLALGALPPQVFHPRQIFSVQQAAHRSDLIEGCAAP